MAFSDIAIRIAADFVGAPSFKKADTAVDKLYKSTKKLATAFGVTFSAAAISRFAATSVRAFIAEERQIATLTSTVKSLGLAFQANEINAYIDDLERATGITRDQLQPSLQKLLTQTGSITKAQEILNAAVHVSFSGLMSVGEATDALTQAYVGNLKGLKRFNLGLSNAELAALGFDGVLAKVEATYKDQFKSAMENTETKINKVKVAADNAKESIGKGLVKAFSDLAGNGDLEKANGLLERTAELVGRITGNLFNPVKVGSFYLPIPNLLAKTQQENTIGNPAQWRRQNLAITKAEAEAAAKAAKREAERLAILRKQNAEKRMSLALDKASKVLPQAKGMFDLEGIQIQAALQGNITDEQRKRLELQMKIWELEQAIASQDVKRIEDLTTQLMLLTSQVMALNETMAALTKIQEALFKIGYDRNLFNLDNLSSALSLLNQMTGSKYTPQSFVAETPLDLYKPLLIDFANAAAEQVVVPEVNISIDGNVQGLIDVVVDGLQQKDASGVSTRIIRNTGGLSW